MKSAFLLAALAAAYAQTPAFDVASIKPSDPATTMAIRRSGYRIATVNTSLLFLITWAYDVHSDRIYGKPNWLDSAHRTAADDAVPASRPLPISHPPRNQAASHVRTRSGERRAEDPSHRSS